MSTKVIDNIRVLTYKNKRLVLPTAKIQSKAIQWYHHCLQHLGENRLEETIVAVVYWKRMRQKIQKLVTDANWLNVKRESMGIVLQKWPRFTYWKHVCVDLIGPYRIKARNQSSIGFYVFGYAQS